MKFLAIICLVILCIKVNAQDVRSKDGKVLGERGEFISSCTQGADKELMNINGLQIEAYKYCACICDNLIPNLNSWEMKSAMEENKLVDLFLKEKNWEVILECLDEGNLKIEDDYEYSNNSELEIEIGIKSCVYEILNDEENKDIWSEKLAKEYCTCCVNKLISAGYTYKDLLEIEDINSPSFNEIVLPCMPELFMEEFKSSNSYNINDIQGGSVKSFIPLIDYLGIGYKLKINVSGSIKYFLFDTGASDLIIDKTIEKELLLNGSLKKENYLNKTEYELANNEIVEGQMVKVDNITIGDYTLNNVIIGIIDEGSLLCGKSFLDKFKKWEIDKKNKVLILYK